VTGDCDKADKIADITSSLIKNLRTIVNDIKKPMFHLHGSQDIFLKSETYFWD
jgi:hypothetical protein